VGNDRIPESSLEKAGEHLGKPKGTREKVVPGKDYGSHLSGWTPLTDEHRKNGWRGSGVRKYISIEIILKVLVRNLERRGRAQYLRLRVLAGKAYLELQRRSSIGGEHGGGEHTGRLASEIKNPRGSSTIQSRGESKSRRGLQVVRKIVALIYFDLVERYQSYSLWSRRDGLPRTLRPICVAGRKGKLSRSSRDEVNC